MGKPLLSRRPRSLICLIFCLLSLAGGLYLPEDLGYRAVYPRQVLAQGSGPLVTDVSSNAANYPNDRIPKYEKFELTFQVKNTVAGNYQLPYDPDPPHGIDLTYPRHQGISVDALFLPPGQTDWNRAYQQPAFYFQDFDDQVKKDREEVDREWFYPTGEFAWKVRFAPNRSGSWQYKIKAVDASGATETTPQSFTVLDSTRKGFIKVSQADPRYFEFDDGSPLYAAGFAYGPNGPPLQSPVLRSEPDFQVFQRNGINLLRVWISGMYGSAWMHYLGGRNIYDGYLPRTGILPFYNAATDRTTLALRLDYEPEGNEGWFDACRFRFWLDLEAVKPHTNYRIRIKYRGFDIAGPRNPGYQKFGFVGKFGTWNPDCYEPGSGVVITSYGLNNSDWQYLEGVWNSGSNNFLPTLYMGLENVIQGQVYVDSVSVQEDLGNGLYGPEIMVEPSMEYELYVPQAEAYALDKLVELAGQYDIYLKLVLMDKNDKIYYKLEDNGEFVSTEDNLDGFYGVGRTLNKTRWLQQAWWRYLQARWGYSPNIHSWELTNEGDPWNENHYALTDELGKYMHCRVFGIPVGTGNGDKCAYDHPNDHTVTTSFWHSFPAEQFWANPNYPNVDYADLHAYISTGWLREPAYESDTARFHLDYSAEVRSNLDWYARQNGIPTRPVIRGETGIDFLGEQNEQPDLALDRQGIWLHNFLWSTLDAGALVELYWWAENIKNQPGPDGQPGLHEIYGSFYNFISTIPLNNGYYQDVAASVSNSDLRVVGQKDLVNQKAHMWIQNRSHTWRNGVDGVSSPPVSGTVTIPGFQGGQKYSIQWWDTYSTGSTFRVTRTEIITARPDGDLVVTVADLVNDTAVKIGETTGLNAAPVFLPLVLKAFASS